MDRILMSSAAAFSDIDCALSDGDFRFVSEIIHREAGIVVRANKQAMVRGRLVRRARELGLPSVQAYCARLRGADLQDELPGLLNAITTNHTAFYREPHHFTHLEETALPRLARDGAGARRLRIWCAAASTGEEPYTIAATLKAFLGQAGHPDALILATDVDTDVLATAEAGAYAASHAARLEGAQRARLGLEPAGPDSVMVSAGLKRLLRFRPLNILHDWPFSGPFQIIFCRNMLIYFDPPTKTAVISRMAELLQPGGYLYLGHSEALPSVIAGLRPCGRSTYIKA
jgi:chemotaxis protein methyltransferase CheR